MRIIWACRIETRFRQEINWVVIDWVTRINIVVATAVGVIYVFAVIYCIGDVRGAVVRNAW